MKLYFELYKLHFERKLNYVTFYCFKHLETLLVEVYKFTLSILTVCETLSPKRKKVYGGLNNV